MPVNFSKMKTITLLTAKKKLYKHRRNADKNFFFVVAFVKRTGKKEPRKMKARFNVRKYLVGGTLQYNPAHHNLIGTFDVEKANYRSINLTTLMYVKLMGEEFIVKENADLAREHLPGLL